MWKIVNNQYILYSILWPHSAQERPLNKIPQYLKRAVLSGRRSTSSVGYWHKKLTCSVKTIRKSIIQFHLSWFVYIHWHSFECNFTDCRLNTAFASLCISRSSYRQCWTAVPLFPLSLQPKPLLALSFISRTLNAFISSMTLFLFYDYIIVKCIWGTSLCTIL